MKNLLALVGAVVVLVAGLGWYLGWYKLGMDKGSPGHPKINVEVESDKIKADEKKVKQAVGEFIKEHESGQGVPGMPTGLQVPQLPPLPPLPSPPASPSPGLDPRNIVIPPPSLPPLPPPVAPGTSGTLIPPPILPPLPPPIVPGRQ